MTTNSSSIRSPLYAPYKAAGLICGENMPFVLNSLGEQRFLTVAVGCRFHVFQLDRLVICLISRDAPGKITNIQVKGRETYASVGNIVYKYTRNTISKEIYLLGGNIKGMEIVGDTLLVYDDSNNVRIINTKNDLIISEIVMLNKGFISYVLHPSTYINKFLFGFTNGDLELWNIKTCKLIYSFQSHKTHLLQVIGKNVSSIASIVQSPACDVVAVGGFSGDIIIMNLKHDHILYHFKQKGSVVSLSFRNDFLADKHPYLVSASSNGSIFTWSVGGESLNQADGNSKLHSVFSAHTGGVTKIEFIHGEPLLISSGNDNSISVWIYDNPDGTARILRSRQGIIAHPKILRFFGDTSYDAQFGHSIGGISAGILVSDASGSLLFSRVDKNGYFDIFSRKDVDNKYMKFIQSEILAMDHCFFSARSWGNLVTIHKNCEFAFLWRIDNRAAVSTVLKLPDNLSINKPYATMLTLSSCGNFAVLGYESGLVARYNIQSGLFRGCYPEELQATSYHSDAAICGLFVNATNTILISLDIKGTLVFWDFIERKPYHSESFKSPTLLLRGNKDSNLIAVSDELHCVRVLDITTFKVCRVFVNCHSMLITDILFSSDGRRLLTSSLDCTIRVWDLPTSRCLSWLRFDGPISSIALSSTGDLYVAKMNSRAFDICVDRSLSESFYFNGEPTLAPIDVFSKHDNLSDLMEAEIEVDLTTKSEAEKRKIQVVGVTTSTMPKTYWSAIFQMDLLRKRKNIITPNKPQQVPFFMQSNKATGVSLPEPQIKAKDASNSSISLLTTPFKSSRRLKLNIIQSSSKLASLIGEQNVDAHTLLNSLKQFAPTEFDTEVRLLCTHDEDIKGLHYLRRIIYCFRILLDRHQEYDIVQAYLYRILIIYAEKLVENYSYRESLLSLQSSVQSNRHVLQQLLHICICLCKAALGVQIVI